MSDLFEKASVSTVLAHAIVAAAEAKAAEVGVPMVIAFGMPTDAWHDLIRDDPPLAAGAVGGISRLVIFGGGYPIKADERIVGGIGVSGGHYTQDMEVANAGLAALG